VGRRRTGSWRGHLLPRASSIEERDTAGFSPSRADSVPAKGGRLLRLWGSIDPHAPLVEQAQAVATREAGYFGPAQDASFVRLRELSFTVTATPGIARALRTTSVAISLLARNLWLWTPYRGTDPEINTNGNADPIMSQTVIPQPRYVVIRVTLGY